MQVRLQAITPHAEVNIVEVARVSSTRKNKSEKPEGLISYLIRHAHWSPFEHAFITFEIVTSKAIGIQLIRHRSFTFQEFSQRYSTVQKMEPVEIRKQAETNRQSSTDVFDPEVDICLVREDESGVYLSCNFRASEAIAQIMDSCMAVYASLLRAGVARECARMVLPLATETTIYMTGSVRSWIHFLQIRDDEHAQKEVQLIAKEIKQLFKQELPIISKALNY